MSVVVVDLYIGGVIESALFSIVLAEKSSLCSLLLWSLVSGCCGYCELYSIKC